MDRGKTASGRGSKSKTPQFPSDLYVLGPKGARTEGNESKRPVPVHTKTGPSHSLADRRRLAGSAVGPSISAAVQPAKKPKLTSAVLSRTDTFVPTTTVQDVGKSWEQAAIDIEAIDLVPTIEAAKDKDENEKIVAVLCGALKLLKASKFKSDSILTSGLFYLAKKYPSIFTKETVFNALCSMLRRESSLMYKAKTTYTNAVLLVNILYFSYQDAKHWPEIFMKLYTEDSLGERLWVDSEYCKCFVDNIIASVNTIASPLLDLDSGLRSDLDDDLIGIIDKGKKDYPVFPRFKGTEEQIENIINDAIKDQLNRRQASEGISKHFLKFLSSMCGITEVRAVVATKLEVWLTNPKLKKSAQELLMSVCVNCTSNTQRDVDIVASIVKIRLKTKDLSAFYLACIRELIPAHNKNLSTVLKQIVNNELFAVRNPNNMPMMAILFQAEPEQFAAILAEIFLEYLMNREDYLRQLRCLLREVTKFLRPDLDLQALARGLMGQTEPIPRDLEYKDRVFNSIADLVTLCMFLTISPHARSDRKDLYQIEKMQTAVANIESDAVWWFHENAYRVYKPATNDFVHALHKVVFMEPADQYYKVDNWPPEQDRALFIRYASEIPLLQRTVLTILAIGLSKEHPVSCADALELVEQLIKRASALTFSLSIPVLPADEPKLIDLLFNLSAYRHPENIELPTGYVPPDLAISNLYWKSWIILLIYCAHVPGVFGTLAWDKYPTLRVLIEMCITNHFVFPQASDDLQFLTLEKQKILEFESYLAAASTKMNITESTSLLLSQLITMDPMGAPRRPPSIVLDQLQQSNASHKIGHLLCRSRSPDFLLDIIRKQGSSQSMPWLADLVQNSEGSFNHLPVQCLCEFLLSSNEKQQGKYQQLLTHLQSLLTDPNKNPNVVCEILDHFLRRLGSHANKEQAISGLKLLLSTFNKDDMETDQLKSHGEQSLWILSKLPKIPHFSAARPQIVRALREACQVENDPELVTSYLTFLAQHAASSSTDLGEMTELVLDMAQLIVERSIIMPAVLRSMYETDTFSNVALKSLLKIFHTYLNKAREPHKNLYTLSEAQEQILITWSTGEKATLYNLVVYAVIILLTYGPQCSESAHRYYESLMKMWFPSQKDTMPKAFLVDTSEEVLFIPDWLKLRMIRSNVTRLVEEALIDLEPAQLFLFSQSFGIPVESMSKLLETLDQAIATKKVSISDIAIDKTYMIQFVDVQHRRGVTGGNILANTIKTLDPEISIPETAAIKIDLTDDEPEFVEAPITRISDSEIQQIVEKLQINSKTTALPPNVKENRQKMLQMLSTELVYSSKAIPYITPVFKKIVNTLRKCVADANYVNELLINFQYPSHVFRLLTTSCNKDHIESLALIAKTILKSSVASSKPKNPLVVTLRSFLSKNNYPEGTSILAKHSDRKESLDVFDNCTVDELERIGSKLMDTEMKKIHGDKTVVESVANLITRSDCKYNNGTGLFIDWLIQIEPEIIGSSLELQLNMLFSQKSETKWKSAQICRPYLLTLLTHHASWTTLERALSSLLTLESTKKYDATAVLEFLWALARNPRLWQGREKLTPKHQEPIDVLSLTEQQLICVIEYIVLEVESFGCNEIGLSKMSSRLSQLVERAIKPSNSKILISMINHLNKESEISALRKTICRNVIAHLYLRVPRVITLLNEMHQSIEFEEISKADRDSSILDVMSHTVMTSFTTNTHVKEWPKRAQELELIIRKMAATHPRLLLRQIRILETSLMGRIHLEWPIFRSRNHLALFQQVFGILELLQPHMFSAEFSEPLQSIFDCYLNLFKNHGGMKDVTVLMNRFVSLLQNFISHDTKRAVLFLQSRSTLLRELEVDHPCIGSLCVLMSGVRDSTDKEILIAASAPHEIETPQWDSIINSFKWEDPAFALLELDHASIRKPTLLEPMLERLFPLLHDPSSYNRSLAHMLLARCVKHNPNSAPRIVPAVFNCLHSDNPDIIETACDRLPELIVCAQENALPILRRLFSLVIKNGIDTVPCITKSIALLNLQSSC